MLLARGSRQVLKRFTVGLLIVLALAACEPEATPLPIDIVPTSASTAVPGAAQAQPIRYAIEATTQMLIPPDDYTAIAANAEVQTVVAPLLETDLGAHYDIVLALGDLANSSHAPEPMTIALFMNTALSPLDDSSLADVIHRRIDTEALVASLGFPGAAALPHTSEPVQALRTSLANLGLPDGFALRLGVLGAPAAEALAAQLATINVDVSINAITADNTEGLERFHLVLFSRALGGLVPEAAPENVIELYTIPISYRAVPELTVEFTAGGFPLARR
jgi:hypothetical protein